MNKRNKENYVLITGASSGIGKEIAMLLGKNDYNLVLTARRNEALLKIKEELNSYDIDVKIFPGDLSNIRIIEELKEKIAVYYATKAYVLSFSEALAVEFKDKGVDIKVLCPGATKTEFSNKAGKADIKNAMEAKEVAIFLYKSLNSKSTVLIPGVFNKISIYSSKLLPRKFL